MDSFVHFAKVNRTRTCIDCHCIIPKQTTHLFFHVYEHSFFLCAKCLTKRDSEYIGIRLHDISKEKENGQEKSKFDIAD